MKYWQKKRNYRKYTREDGSVAYIITVDGQDVAVSAGVYEAYAQGDRRERYQSERDNGLVLSLNRLAEDEMQLSHLTDRHIESAEDTAVRNLFAQQALTAFDRLEPEEQLLIRALIIEGMTERDYAAILGISQVAVNRRKQRLLKKVLNLLNL